MLKKIFFIFCFFSIAIFIYVYITSFIENNYDESLDYTNIEKLQELDYSLYQAIKLKDYYRAEKIITDFEWTFNSINLKDYTSVEGIDAITATLKDTVQLLNSSDYNHSSILYAVSRLHLAIDALFHKEQPLWHRYYPLIEEDIIEIRKAIIDKDQKQTEKNIYMFLEHYNLIKPAILVSGQPYIVDNIDSLVTALIKQNIIQNKEMILNQIQSNVHQIFYGSEFDTMGNITIKSFVWKASLLVGFIIFIVLAYVIWRKSLATLKYNKR